jgi:hypothetical protein
MNTKRLSSHLSEQNVQLELAPCVQKLTRVAGLHRASPSATLDKSSKLLYVISIIIWMMYDLVNGKKY